MCVLLLLLISLHCLDTALIDCHLDGPPRVRIRVSIAWVGIAAAGNLQSIVLF